METVEGLVERARHLSLHQTHSFDTFHATIDSHLKKIYEFRKSAGTPKFLELQHDSSPAGQPIADHLASLDAFRAYMKDDASSAQALPTEPDLSAPISDYFISSSHNTYLTGNQLYSDAAASAYTSALLQGCRSVEIDVWDGEPHTPDSSDGDASSDSSDSSGDEGESVGAKIKQKIKSKTKKKAKPARGLSLSVSTKLGDALRRGSSKSTSKTVAATATAESAMSHEVIQGEPRVLHGHTLTKGTSFREICYAIRDSAFVVSDLPIIISFEVHANLEQQQIMVDIINEAWKGMLVEVPSEMAPEKLPALGELKRKILIKTKSTPLKAAEEKADVLETVEEPSEQSTEAQKTVKPSKILEALAKMAVYTRAYHFSHFDQPEAKSPLHVFSLSEKAAREAHATNRDALFEHNRSSIMRIYPFAFRLVALNWQNLDKGMMLNHGMFAGTQGWELKPPSYQSAHPAAKPITHTLDLTLEIFAAQDLSLPAGDHVEKWFRPYVNCQLHVEEPEPLTSTGTNKDKDDASSDSEKSSYRRCTKSSSGRNPDFEGQKLIFPTVTGVIEELSFLRFKIKDDEIGRDALAAWACIRVDRLREGYRLVHLHDTTGEKTGGMLLVRISKQVS
ncbi:Dolichyl-phosphate-mannose--protein mannosyltransferase 1 [Penicillium atrosanguineum]|uniref:Dolichyl-phosphate-mannose--protein mannosyltransferase 1 n=1 Tax=Penicillium atrosanguineum TaxID=1132637 RepID=UPI0023947620|nr:Dolichyl-phosphate-mannose--protein mannosyltransferase 1 [Penicillium atrosanguineum]KAJ5296703.1 Dolichyl-phosphate-mannose--protein mannosyltransferase 1 [Penicillium atrosanguineum]